MIKTITILLLLLMAGQTAGIMYSEPVLCQFAQDQDEKKETVENKKEMKEFLTGGIYFIVRTVISKKNNSSFQFKLTSPVLDQLTPPPDHSPLS